MDRMQVGDEVKVVCKSSPWWDARGVITEIIQRRDEQNGKTLQECAVTFKAGRGWFMAEHLIRVRPSNTDRLLGGEACIRWPIEPDCAESIDVSRDTLIPFLCAHFGFSGSMATTELDDFLNMFEEKLRRARQSEDPIQYLKAS